MCAQRFYTSDALFVWTNLGKHLLFVWLFVSSIKTGTRRIMRLEELSFEIRLERRTKRDIMRLDKLSLSASFKTYFKGSSSRRIIRLVPVFILKTQNQMNFKCLPKFFWTDNASLV